MSSPAVGKTVLLERTLVALSNELKITVIEGDMITEFNADHFRRYNVLVRERLIEDILAISIPKWLQVEFIALKAKIIHQTLN
jgi:Ni2+-binding GTPase involved in maturation of urease and hydrogenase